MQEMQHFFCLEQQSPTCHLRIANVNVFLNLSAKHYTNIINNVYICRTYVNTLKELTKYLYLFI